MKRAGLFLNLPVFVDPSEVAAISRSVIPNAGTEAGFSDVTIVTLKSGQQLPVQELPQEVNERLFGVMKPGEVING